MNKLKSGRRGKQRRTYQNIFLHLLFLINIGFLSVSCEKELTPLGKGILPPEDYLYSFCDSFTNIKTYTVEGRELNTFRNGYIILGSTNDPYFGFSKASVITEFLPNTTLDSIDGSKIVVDSVALYLIKQSYLGDTLADIEISVYEVINAPYTSAINFDFYLNKKEYTDIVNTGLEPNDYIDDKLLGRSTFHANDSIVVINITDTNFISRLFHFNRFDSASYFIEQFKGLYITTNDLQGEGALVTFNMSNYTSTRMEIVYLDTSNDDPATLSFDFYYTRRFNLFTHDHTNSEVSPYINDSTGQDSIFFVQGMGGINSIIELTGLDSLKEKLHQDTILITRAELILTPAFLPVPFWDTTAYYPHTLMLYKYNESDPLNLVNLPDHLVINGNPNSFYTYIDGNYNYTLNRYKFNLTYYVQQYFNGVIDYKKFILLAGDNYQNTYTPGGVVLRSSICDNPIKFKIYYTTF